MNARYLAERGWPCPEGRQMSQIDRDTIEGRGIPGRVLMENAGRAISQLLRQRFPAARRPLVVCGGGNNGGDGFVVARLLHDWDDPVTPTVVVLGDPARASDEARENFELLMNSGVELIVRPGQKEIEALLARCDLLVDAVFGVGLAREVEGALAAILRALNHCGCPVLSVDLPSGVSSDTGAPLGAAVEPDVVVTLGLPKLGLAVRPLAAEIWVADIGLPWAVVEAVGIRQRVLGPAAAAALLPTRPLDAHKGTFGHVLIIAGCEGKTGAACLAAEGALRAGAGLVTAAVPASLNPIFEIKLTEAMTLPVADAGRACFIEANLQALLAAASERDVVVLGPGVGQDKATIALLERLVPRLELPLVIDADALNAFAARPSALRGDSPRVLTPHPGEAARLLDDSTAAVQADRVKSARALAEVTGSVVLLKGARSVIAAPDGEVLLNPTAGAGLATGGTGDVLAGIVAALLAQGLDAFQAAGLGAYLHGRAGELAGPVGGLAGELAARIPTVWRELLQAGDVTDDSGVLRRFP